MSMEKYNNIIVLQLTVMCIIKNASSPNSTSGAIVSIHMQCTQKLQYSKDRH